MLTLFGVALLVLLEPASCDDTVADDISSHMMDRISELLSPEECQSFYGKITGPEENVVLKLERLSEGNNPIRPRRRRDITSAEQCKKTLSHWLDSEGDTMYWDRLSQVLQAIGRSDVAIELGKNLNQDKNLEIKKNVEEYHKTVQRLTSSLLLEENEMRGPERLRRDEKWTETVPELEKWDMLELIVEWKSLAPYNRSLFGWVTPLVLGVFAGFLVPFVIGGLALYSFLWILKEGCSKSERIKAVKPVTFSEGGAVYYMYQQFGEPWKDDTKPASDYEDEDDDNDND